MFVYFLILKVVINRHGYTEHMNPADESLDGSYVLIMSITSSQKPYQMKYTVF